jgi:hypothetical protein
MIDIIISEQVVVWIPFVLMWAIVGSALTGESYIMGSNMGYAIVRGFALSFIILMVISIIVSLFLPSPLGIQIFNISVGAPWAT